jgi:regulator of protease activity HflC (stomatin/prohibitin superfamily)
MIKKVALWVLLGIVVAAFLVFLGQCKTIQAGHRGVLLTWGRVEEKIWDEGIHFKRPISQKVIKVDVRIKKTQAEVGAASRDLQETTAEIALNYHLQPDRVNFLIQRIGSDYEIVVIAPALSEVTKATTAKYTAEELITKRELVKNDIQKMLYDRLKDYDIYVDNFSIINFSFSKQFENAIEEKQTATQNALKAVRDLERIKVEAEQRVTNARAEADSTVLKAKAEAESLRLQREVLTPNLIQLRAIEKWNGQLPTYTGSGAIPFLDLNK